MTTQVAWFGNSDVLRLLWLSGFAFREAQSFYDATSREFHQGQPFCIATFMTPIFEDNSYIGLSMRVFLCVKKFFILASQNTIASILCLFRSPVTFCSLPHVSLLCFYSDAHGSAFLLHSTFLLAASMRPTLFQVEQGFSCLLYSSVRWILCTYNKNKIKITCLCLSDVFGTVMASWREHTKFIPPTGDICCVAIHTQYHHTGHGLIVSSF